MGVERRKSTGAIVAGLLSDSNLHSPLKEGVIFTYEEITI